LRERIHHKIDGTDIFTTFGSLLKPPISDSGGDSVASSSTVSEVLREIEGLFRWNPPPLSLPEAPKKNRTTTRPPAFYDKHFNGRLTLQHVKRLPSLVQALATNVDRKLSAAEKTLPSRPMDASRAFRETAGKLVSRIAPDEKGVANYYNQTTPLYCLEIAPTLVLHPKASMSEWQPLLLWTQSVTSTGYAISDGELRIRKDVDEDKLRGILAFMDPEIRRMYEKMKGPPPMSLATWEFKSLTAGTDAVMDAVRNLDEFSWTYCQVSGCGTSLKHTKQKEEIAKIKIGPDASTPPWDLNVSSFASNLADRC